MGEVGCIWAGGGCGSCSKDGTLLTSVGNVHMDPDGGFLNSLFPLIRDDCALVYHLESDAFSKPLQRESIRMGCLLDGKRWGRDDM